MPSYSEIVFAMRRLAVATVLCASVAGSAALAALHEQSIGLPDAVTAADIDWPPTAAYGGDIDWPPLPPQG